MIAVSGGIDENGIDFGAIYSVGLPIILEMRFGFGLRTVMMISMVFDLFFRR